MKSKSSLKSAIKAVAATLCVVSACAYGANLPQVAFHVSPTGDDSADGSCERPFATVARARDAVRALKKSGALPKGGVNVWLRGGEYPMREFLVLGKEDSGADGAPVAYRAWKGEQPVLTGAWTVPPSAWRLADDPRIPAEAKGKVWVADVKSLGYDALEPDALCGFHTARPKFRIRSLTCDGKRLTLARHPNTGFLRTGTVVDKAGVFKADLDDMTRWSRANAPGLEALGYWRYLWADQTVPVCVDPAAGTVSFALDAAAFGTDAETSFHLSETSAAAAKSDRLYSMLLVKGMPFYLQNALAALDAPGEWYLDRTTGLLYVCPEDAKGDPSKCRYELSLAVKSLVSAKDAAYIRFEGIAFRDGRHHGVEMRGVSDVKIERCDFRNFGGHGLVLDHARDSLVRGCSFRTFGHCAMTLDGGDRKTLTTSGVTIECCDFSDTGLAMRTYTPGIWVMGCGHRIVRNDFHDLPSSAVRIIGNEHLFASNLVERVVQESDDQGAVDMWGDPTYRGNKFIHNIFRDVGRDGAFVRCGQGGIRFDDSISGNLVYGNRFHNCSKVNFGGVQIHGGRDNVVRNNVFTRCRYGITVSQWSQAHWRNFLSGERGKTSRAAANVEGAAFKAKYPEFASALDTPMRNTFECNVFEGDEKSFTLRAPATTVMRGNVCVPKLPADLSSIPGFEPLPPESAIGAAASVAAHAVNDARIDEIAQWLPESPRADGAPACDRTKWEPLAATKEGQTAIQNAEKISGEPVPDTPDELYLEFSRNGNRSNYQKCFFRRKANFVWLYVGECLERKGRFIPKIVEYMDAFCAMKSWTLPAHDGGLTCFNGDPHIDLCSAELSRELAFCLSWLGDAIPAATRAKVYAEIDRRTFQPHLAHARGARKRREHWWFHGGNNWNSVCNCCVVRAALALIPDRRLRAEFVMHAEGSVPYALAGYTDDGYCSEGMGYWNYGYGHHIMMGLSLRAATGGKIDLFANPKTKTVMAYAYGFQLQSGRSPHFADGGGNPSPVLLALGRQVWPDLVSTAALKSAAFGFDTAQFSLRAFGQEPAPCAPTMDVLPVRTWFPDAQVLISRRPNNDRKLELSVAIKGGHNAELHNHNDVGSYTVMMDGVEMCGDPGGEVYTRRTFSKDRYVSKVLNSYGHPVPVVGGKLQNGGRKAAAKVLKTEFTDAKDEIVLDYTAAYGVPALKSLVRTMSLDRKNCTVTITDAVAFTEPTAFEVPVITYREWTANGDFTQFMFSKSPTTHRKMKMSVKVSAPVEFTKELIDNPGKPSPQRLAFAFKEPVTEATFTTVFSPR